MTLSTRPVFYEISYECSLQEFPERAESKSRTNDPPRYLIPVHNDILPRRTMRPPLFVRRKRSARKIVWNNEQKIARCNAGSKSIRADKTRSRRRIRRRKNGQRSKDTSPSLYAASTPFS